MARSEHDVASGKDDMDTTENPIIHSDEMYGITTSIILKHREMLTDTLQDTKYGILEKLLASGGLTQREMTGIGCLADPYERSSRLIDLVLQKNILSQFIKALVDTNQQHLVNYLRGDGVRNVEFGDDWPLTEDRIKQLDMNQENLIDILDPCDSGLIYKLFSTKVIDKRQLSFISEERSSISKNKALLDMIRRQSVKDYDRTIVCLTESKQPRIVQILEGSGAICRIHVSQEGDPEIVNETEVAFSDRFANSLRGLSIEEVQRILEMTHLKFIASQKAKSIYLYVYSETLEELMALHNLLLTGEMKTIVETLFNKLVSRQDLIVASCTYSDEEFDKCRSYFEESDSAHSKSFAASKDMPQVETTQHKEFQTSPFAKDDKKGSTTTGLPTTHLPTTRFRTIGNGSDEENMNNVRDLLIERMDPDFGLIDKLLQLKALSFPETGRIRGEKSVFERNEKLLELISVKKKHQALLTALTSTGQKHLFNLVKGNGEYRPEYGSVWPLRERETQILDENRFNLAEIIDPCDLITRMFSKDVITNRQKLHINCLRNNLEKAEALLDVLRRGSEECYLKTALCLQETHQSVVAKILIDGGVLEKVHVSNEGEAEQVSVEEERIVESLEALLQNTSSLPQYQRIRERLYLQIMRNRKEGENSDI